MAPTEGSNLPTVTVIMPVRNEAAHIEGALRAVMDQDYPHHLTQVLIVDGRSEDDTRKLIREVAALHSERQIEIIDNPGRTAPCALNAGLQHANGQVIVRVDGHCQIGPNYVRNGVAHLTAGEAEGVGGVLQTVGETTEAKAIAAAMSSGFGVGGSAFRTSNAEAEAQLVDTVAFPAYLRTVLDQAGPFDQELVRNQDDEYNYRIRKAGGRILLVPDMPVRYSSRAQLRALFRQYFQYGYWKVRVLQKHPKQMSLRQFAPPLLVLSLLVVPLASLVFRQTLGPTTPWVAISPAVVYLAANLWATSKESRRRAVNPVALAVAFSLLHIGYGLGFLVGLCRFAGRWGRG